MANTVSTTETLKRVRDLEKELELLKMGLFLNWRRMKNKTSIVKRTSGILGRKFPSGIRYEKTIRKDWDKRFNKS